MNDCDKHGHKVNSFNGVCFKCGKVFDAPIDGLIDYLSKMDKEIKKTIEGINKDSQKDFDLFITETKKDMERFGDCIEQIQLRIQS